MRVVWLACVVACGAGMKPVEPRDAAGDLTGDVTEISKLLRDTVTNGGLWFDDAQCTAKFSAVGDIQRDQLPAFARCLAGLKLQRSARTDALGDVAVLSYAPGFEIEARIVNELDGPRLAWIGFAVRSSPAEPPTITVEALEALRTSGERNGPIDAATASLLQLDPTPTSRAEYTWLKVCIDEMGAVTSTRVYETTSWAARNAFVAASSSWAFSPFLIMGQAVPVCAMVRPAYPPGEAPKIEELPLPLRPSDRDGRDPVVFAPGTRLLEGKRIKGSRTISPDDRTKTAIAKARVSRLVGKFRLCVAESGRVESVLPLRSTGFADYDRRLLGAMRQWAYSPYMIDDKAVPVCTSVTFIYTQR